MNHNWCEHTPTTNPLNDLDPEVLRHCLRCHEVENGQ